MNDRILTGEDGPSLWSAARLGGSLLAGSVASAIGNEDLRIPCEHDYDRLLFSTPVRRMADKTQVFPLERNDGVRTRLTHSHEVSNLARSIGNRLIRRDPDIFGCKGAATAAPIMLASAGLAHDLGNPPFGHQGENAIRRWFVAKGESIFNSDQDGPLSLDLRNDFLKFEGNAQTLRLVTRLQVSAGGYGLDLTAGTLAAMAKYTVPASAVDQGKSTSKKPGFLASENDVIEWMREKTGLRHGERHPLAWLVEACDDAAYCVLDIEDAIKKSIVSPEDVSAYLRRHVKSTVGSELCQKLEADYKRAEDKEDSYESDEIKTGYLRSRLIEALLTSAARSFLNCKEKIFRHEQEKDLLSVDPSCGDLHKRLKKFARSHAYNHPVVLRTELDGAIALTKLLDWIWYSITEREDANDPASNRKDPFASYVYGSIVSRNYKRILEGRRQNASLPLRYYELQLLTDMISGMTDGFAMKLYKDLKRFDHV